MGCGRPQKEAGVGGIPYPPHEMRKGEGRHTLGANENHTFRWSHTCTWVCACVCGDASSNNYIQLHTYKAYKATIPRAHVVYTQSGSPTGSPIEMPSHQISNGIMCMHTLVVSQGARGDDHTAGRENNNAKPLSIGSLQALEKRAACHALHLHTQCHIHIYTYTHSHTCEHKASCTHTKQYELAHAYARLVHTKQHICSYA